MSDPRDRDEFLQLAAEALNHDTADEFMENNPEIRATLLLAYHKMTPPTNDRLTQEVFQAQYMEAQAAPRMEAQEAPRRHARRRRDR